MKSKYSIQSQIILIFLVFLAAALVSVYGSLSLNSTLRGHHQRQALLMQQHRVLLAGDEVAETREGLRGLQRLLEEEQAVLAVRSRAILRMTVWFVVVLTVLGFALTVRACYQLESVLLKPLEKMILALAAIVEPRGEQGELTAVFDASGWLKRLPPQNEASLDRLSRLCNVLLDKSGESNDMLKGQLYYYEMALSGLMSCQKVATVVLTGDHRVLYANNEAKEMFVGEGGERFKGYLCEAARQGHNEFSSHGKRYSLVRAVTRKGESKSNVVNVYQFDVLGDVVAEGPKPQP